jgi:hypothetical protein
MSFKFDLQTFAYTNDGDKYNFIDDESMVISADINMRPYFYMAWMLENIEDLGTINSMSESTSAKKDFWNKDRKVSQLTSVFSTFIDYYVSNTYKHGLPKKYEDLNKKCPDKKFVDIAYMNNAISHMKIQEGADLLGAFCALGLTKNNSYDSELATVDELDITTLELEKADNITCLLADALVNVNATGIKLNPKLKTLDGVFSTKNGYVKGILDIDYSNIEEANTFLPGFFYKNESLKAILGDTNKVIKFSKPPKKIKDLGTFISANPANTDYLNEDPEYVLDLSNWDLSHLNNPKDSSVTLFSNIYCKEVIFPEGFVLTPEYSVSGLISSVMCVKKIRNLSIDFSKINEKLNTDEASNVFYNINSMLTIYDKEWQTAHLDPDCKIKFINFNETKFYQMYKAPNNGYDGEEYTLDTFYTDFIGIPKENIEFINKI